MVKTIFYILATLLSLAAAYFGFTNHSVYDEQKNTYLTAKDKKDNFNLTNDKRSEELEEAKELLLAANTKGSELEASLDLLKSDQVSLERSIAEYNGQIEAADAKLAEAENLLVQLRQLFPDGELDDIPDIISGLENDVNQSQKELDEKLIVSDKLTTVVSNNIAEVGRLDGKIGEIKQRIKGNSLEARLSSVDNQWGFVVINGVGSNNGISGDTKLVVHRGNRFLGRLQISSLEPNQIVADIDKRTMASGIRLSPGDRVILEEPASN